MSPRDGTSSAGSIGPAAAWPFAVVSDGQTLAAVKPHRAITARLSATVPDCREDLVN